MNKMKAKTGIDRQDIEHVQFSSHFVRIFMNRHGRGVKEEKIGCPELAQRNDRSV
jgi:hypothetical protein